MSDFVSVTCHQCKEVSGLSRQTYNVLLRSGQTFYCPWGHGGVYSAAPTEADLLRKERDTLKQQMARKDDEIRQKGDEVRAERAWREAAQNQARAYKGVATRVKNRVGKGVCPCCNRTFANLQRHMAGKHPTFTHDDVPHHGAIQ